jgi:hypothetical protein
MEDSGRAGKPGSLAHGATFGLFRDWRASSIPDGTDKTVTILEKWTDRVTTSTGFNLAHYPPSTESRIKYEKFGPFGNKGNHHSRQEKASPKKINWYWTNKKNPGNKLKQK